MIAPAIAVVAAGVMLYWEWITVGAALGSSALVFASGEAVILGAVVFVFLSVAFLPSVRRLGISPDGIELDVGVRKFHYSWDGVREVTRTHTRRFRRDGSDSIVVTRVSVGYGWTENRFRLSANQGDRLAHFMRIA